MTYLSVHQHILNIVQSNKIPDPSTNNSRFKFLIETLLSKLNNILYEELLVIVIDALDECSSLRHNLSRKDNHKGLLHMLKHWIYVDHLKKFKLILTSWHDEFIQKMFPESMSIHINIPFDSNVNPGDSTSHDIHIFPKSQLDSIGEEGTWIKRALNHLVPCATGIFIWVMTVADSLEVDP